MLSDWEFPFWKHPSFYAQRQVVWVAKMWYTFSKSFHSMHERHNYHMLSMKHIDVCATPEMTNLIQETLSTLKHSVPNNDSSRERHEQAVAVLSEALEVLLERKSVTLLNSEAMLTPVEAAALALISRGSLLKMVRDGELPAQETERGTRILLGDARAIRNKTLEEKRNSFFKLLDFEAENHLDEILNP